MFNLQHLGSSSKTGIYRLRVSRVVPGRVELVPAADHDPVDLKNAIYDWIAQHDSLEQQRVNAAQVRQRFPWFSAA